jgi:hypothetical protein
MRTKVFRREGSIRVLHQLPHPVSKVHTDTGMIFCVSDRLAGVVFCSKRENALRASRIRMRFDWYRLIFGCLPSFQSVEPYRPHQEFPHESPRKRYCQSYHMPPKRYTSSALPPSLYWNLIRSSVTQLCSLKTIRICSENRWEMKRVTVD